VEKLKKKGGKETDFESSIVLSKLVQRIRVQVDKKRVGGCGSLVI